MQELLVPAASVDAALNKERAGRNRTINLTDEDRRLYAPRLLDIATIEPSGEPPIGTINSDFQQVVTRLPNQCIDSTGFGPAIQPDQGFSW